MQLFRNDLAKNHKLFLIICIYTHDNKTTGFTIIKLSNMSFVLIH